MTRNLDMSNKRIKSIPLPVRDDEAASKKYVDNNFFNMDGTSSMVGSLHMNDHRTTGLSLHPLTADEAVNKKYLDDQIKKSNIKPSHTVKNVFQYLMNDSNEWTAEDGCDNFKIDDLDISPHYWHKNVFIYHYFKKNRKLFLEC